MRKKYSLNSSTNKSIKMPAIFRKMFGIKSPSSSIYIFACISLMLSSVYFGKELVSHFHDFTAILYKNIYVPMNKINTLIHFKNRYFNALEHIQILEAEKEELQAKHFENEILKQENESLREIAHHMNSFDFEYITTRVVSSLIDNSGMNMMVNSGSRDGLYEGQPVVSASGLIGRITKVNTKSAGLLLINNSLSKIPVLLLKSNIKCIAAGYNGSNMLRIQYLDQSQRPIQDELVVTSGEGGLVPFGIRVGQVKILKEAEEYMIKPNADFGNINLVSVIINKSES